MKPMRVLIVCVVTVVFFLWSCDEDGNFAIEPEQPNAMPNAVGMLWVYEVYDSLTQTVDTVSVSITDSLKSGQSGVVWKTYWQAGDSVSERVAVVSGDTLDFIIDTTFIVIPLERFVFPLEAGNQWTIPPGPDTSTVTERGSVTVPAGTFANSSLVERVWNIGLDGGFDKSLTWVAPQAGVVRRYLYSSYADGGGGIFIAKNQLWQLVDYDLTTFSIHRFPGEIGSEWAYEVVDSWQNTPDTVTVTVSDYAVIPDFDSAKVWLTSGMNLTDTQYVAYVSNQVWASDDTLMNALWDWRYEFPLTVGRHWGLVMIPEARIPVIDAKVSVTTPAGTFPSAFKYSMSGGAFNTYWTVNDWLAPGVGVVKRRYTIWDFGPGHTQEWTLLGFDLK